MSKWPGGWCREDIEQVVLTVPCNRDEGLASIAWEEWEEKENSSPGEIRDKVATQFMEVGYNVEVWSEESQSLELF